MTALHQAKRGLISILFTTTLLVFFSVGSSFAASCPCLGGVDNYCLYGPSYPECAMTYPGGYCDPNGDGDFADADWVKGYYAYQETCPDGGPNPPPPTPGGGNDYSPWIYGIHWYGDNYGSSEVEAMTGGKGIWVLETVTIWDGWTVGDQLQKFETIVDRGHTLILRIQPRWGWSIPAPGPERQQYLDAVEAAAQQAKDVCHIWQIGNEMNLYGEYGGGVLTAQEYIDYFKQIRQRIKNVSSSLGPQIVLVGPVSPGAYAGEVRHTDGLQYLGQMSALLNANDFDGFALHAYGAPWLDANGARWDFQNGSGGYAAQLAVIDNHGFRDKPTFILEFNRQTPNEDAGQEAQTAQFIIGAYQDLQAWNNNPNNHPIICATWFIYADVANWEIFSLRHLRDRNLRGVNQDVWDSFQYACNLNIPAGDLSSDPPPPPADSLDAAHTGNTIPAAVQPNQTVQISVTLKNTGSTPWRASSNDRLGTGDDNAFIWSGFADGGYSNSATDQRVFLAGTDAIATGSTKTFTFSITAPPVAGQYTFSAGMVRDGVSWFGDTISKTITVNSSNGSSLTNGEPKGSFGSGGQTDEVTEPETWRWSEWFYGFQGIDNIAWGTDGCGQNHNYAMGWHQDDLIEYRMKFGGEFSRLVLRGLADQPGPVKLEIYIDGLQEATAFWDNDDNCNQDAAVEIAGIVYGTHAIAVKFVNDDYDPPEDRNFYLDGLRVEKPSGPAPPPPPAGKSKLSIHTSFLGSESMRFIEQARPTVVKILDELKVAQEVKQKSPHTLIVGRIWYDTWQRLGEGSPEDRALEWWQDVRETILAYPAVDYWEGYNEPAIHDAGLMSWYARFELKRVEILASHGRKACVGNFSTGMPPVERDVWEAFYPAIDAANMHAGVLGLHEYSAPDMVWLFDDISGEGWLTGRYRKVYRQFLIPDGREIPLIITECGIDGGVQGEPGKGWRSYQDPDGYVDQLKWYDSLLKQDSYVLGATIFSLEIHNWWDFDIGGLVREMIEDYVRSSGQ